MHLKYLTLLLLLISPVTILAEQDRIVIPFLPASNDIAGSVVSGESKESPRSTPRLDVAEEEFKVRVLIKGMSEASLASRMDGHIDHIEVRAGESFKKGSELVRFDCRREMATLSEAKATLSKAQKTHQSRRALFDMEAVSSLDVELAEADVDQAKAGVEKARVQVQDCRITAPFNGRVVRVLANQYENVNANRPLIEVVDSEHLRVEALVPSIWLRWLKKGQLMNIEVDELGQQIQAEIVQLGAKVDPVSQTVLVVGKFNSKTPSLLPGMSGVAVFAR